MRRWLLLAVGALATAALVGCGGGGASRADYQASVQETRDRVDSALASIVAAESREQLTDFMEEAANEIDAAAQDLEDAGGPNEFEDENAALVKAFRQLATDLAATAEQLRQPDLGDLLQGTRGLSFESFVDANRVLEQLRKQGVEVAPLQRH